MNNPSVRIPIMKKILLLFLTGFFLAACGPKEYNLSSAPAFVNLPDSILTDSVIIHGSNGKCKVEYFPEWLDVELVDSVLKYTTKKADINGILEDNVVISCGKSMLTISFREYPKATKLELPNGNEILVPQEGDTVQLSVICDGFLRVESSDGVNAWYEDGVVNVSSPKNEGGRKRETIKLLAGDFSKDITVVLDGIICENCKGAGYITCKKCGGQGYTVAYGVYAYGCKSCGGSGCDHFRLGGNLKMGSGKQICPVCNGQGGPQE